MNYVCLIENLQACRRRCVSAVWQRPGLNPCLRAQRLCVCDACAGDEGGGEKHVAAVAAAAAPAAAYVLECAAFPARDHVALVSSFMRSSGFIAMAILTKLLAMGVFMVTATSEEACRGHRASETYREPSASCAVPTEHEQSVPRQEHLRRQHIPD